VRADRGLPTADEHGQIRIETVNSLTFENLLAWVDSVLHRNDPAAGADRSDLPHSFLSKVYHRLDPQVRACFEDVILGFLAELAHQRLPKWNNDAGDELLLLVGSIFKASPNRRAPVEHLRFLVERWRDEASSDAVLAGIDLRWRALQSLVAIEYRAEPEFWRRHYDKTRSESAVIIFAGLSLRDLEAAFLWLEEIDDEHVLKALVSRLPRLIELSGVERVDLYVRKLVRVLPSQQRASLIGVAQRLGLNVSGEPYLGIFSEWTESEILNVAMAVGIRPSPLEESRELIMEFLVDSFDRRARAKGGFDLTRRNAKAIVAAIWVAQERPYAFSDNVTKKIVTLSETLVAMDFISEDLGIDLLRALAKVKYRRIDPREVFAECAQSLS
jgi:hypothetical protein